MLKWFLPIAAFAWLGLQTSAGAGAPQILALVETDAPVPLSCDGDNCRAELSAFCLQRDQAAPQHGTPYQVRNRDSLRLVLRAADGTVLRLAAPARLAINSVRSYSAVAVSLPQAVLREAGAVGAGLEVGEAVSLLPRVIAQDPDHGDDVEVKLATGPLRKIGRRVVDRGGVEIAIVRATNALINAVPVRDVTLPPRRTTWKQDIFRRLAEVNPKGLPGASAAFDDCAGRMRYPGGESFRACLQFRHDAMMDALTREYWEAAGAGS
jgi:hypothetical protein